MAQQIYKGTLLVLTTDLVQQYWYGSLIYMIWCNSTTHLVQWYRFGSLIYMIRYNITMTWQTTTTGRDCGSDSFAHIFLFFSCRCQASSLVFRLSMKFCFWLTNVLILFTIRFSPTSRTLWYVFLSRELRHILKIYIFDVFCFHDFQAVLHPVLYIVLEHGFKVFCFFLSETTLMYPRLDEAARSTVPVVPFPMKKTIWKVTLKLGRGEQLWIMNKLPQSGRVFLV